MKLLVVSHTSHYLDHGTIVGWGPTVREIDALTELFEEVIHVATLDPSEAPESSLPYRSARVRLALVPSSGGSGFRAKLRVLLRSPAYLRAVLRELRSVEAVHVRCPANISLLTILLLAAVSRPAPRWVKYAGNWMPDGSDPLTYRFQRWWLRRGLHRGVVTVNGEWPHQPEHVFSFLNPSFTEEEVEEARAKAESKRLTVPVRLLFVGRLDEEKGAGRALEVFRILLSRGIEARLDIVGDGPEKRPLEERVRRLGVDGMACLHGWRPRHALREFYAAAHCVLLPTEASEGWPKVLSEAMAHGVVPLAGAVSSIPSILERTGAGKSFPPRQVEAFARAVEYYVRNPSEWEVASRAGARTAPSFGYATYLDQLGGMFRKRWGIQLSPGSGSNGLQGDAPRRRGPGIAGWR